MEITSLVVQTDLIFTRFQGEVEDRGDFIVAKTLNNPDYHWGNYIIFKSPPENENFDDYVNLFQEEFKWISPLNHMVFAWDEPTKPKDCSRFEKFGFDLGKNTVLAARHTMRPTKTNDDVKVREIRSSREWNDVVDLQSSQHDGHEPKSFRAFKEKQFRQYESMVEQGFGCWYGAYMDNRLVGDLGIFRDKDLGRFQSVETHPEFRNQGVCRTLVYESFVKAQEKFNLKTLVMAADADYHAAKIYEKVGFQPVEESYALYYWKNPD